MLIHFTLEPVGGVTKVEADSDGEESLEKREESKEEEEGEKMSYPGQEHQVGAGLDTDDNMYRVQQPFAHHRSENRKKKPESEGALKVK